MKNSTFKLLATFLLTSLIYTVNAQVQVCENGSLNLQTDIDPLNGGDNPDGTSGSFYTWTTTGGTYTDFAPGSNPNGDSNKATFDFTGIAVGTTVTITVVETNGTCVGDPINFSIIIVAGPTAPTVVADPLSICSGDDAVFTITGTPGNVFTYTINGGPALTETILPTGTVDVIIVGVTANQTIDIISVANDANPGACTTTVAGVTATVTVNAAPVTSPIQVL